MSKKTYDVTYTADALAHICVEAENEEEAIRIANERKYDLTWKDFDVSDSAVPVFCDIEESDN